MTEPLKLVVVLLLTVCALGIGYLAFNAMSAGNAQSDADIRACVRRDVDTGDVSHCYR